MLARNFGFKVIAMKDLMGIVVWGNQGQVIPALP